MVQVVLELLRLYSNGFKYQQAYELTDKTRSKLELSFSIDAGQRLAELDKAVKMCVCLDCD